MDSIPHMGFFCGEGFDSNGELRCELPVDLGASKIYAQGFCTIGMFSYVGRNGVLVGCSIGRYVSIASEVCIGPNEHPTDHLTTHPLAWQGRTHGLRYGHASCFADVAGDNPNPPKHEKRVTIGNDVWIGDGAKVMRGVTVGDGAIIAAGAIVTKDVKPYEIVGGVPAKHIRMRFSEDRIKRLMNVQFWKWDLRSLGQRLPFQNVDECLLILEDALAKGSLRELKSSEMVIRSYGDRRFFVENDPDWNLSML